MQKQTIFGIKALLFLAILFLAPRVFGIRINLSPSLPAGLYVRSASGQYVEFCPPGEWAAISAARSYRDAGGWQGILRACPEGSQPLLKPAMANAGDIVTVSGDGISVNGSLLPNSAARVQDSLGRPLAPWKWGEYRVRKGEIWVVSSFHPRSFDSRYFGPVPVASIISRVRPLLTW